MHTTNFPSRNPVFFEQANPFGAGSAGKNLHQQRNENFTVLDPVSVPLKSRISRKLRSPDHSLAKRPKLRIIADCQCNDAVGGIE